MKIEAFVLLIFLLLVTSSKKATSVCYESIISFGDSLADTGNFIRLESPNLPAVARPPYGRTFFNHPTGRFSDGRLIIDFIAESLGLPHVNPYIKGRDENFSRGGFEKGVNFAVGGCVALDVEYFEDRGIDIQNTSVTLGVQMNWFKHFFTTIPDSRKYIQSSLILVGEIGGNDYNYPLFQGKSIDVELSIVPDVINKIGTTIEELIGLGAQTMLVAGSTPIGCLPVYLTEFITSNMTDYDPKSGCINTLNELSKYHNELLQTELNRIQIIHPRVNIIYADYYNAAMALYLSPNEFGFNRGDALKACCGGGGMYNYNESAVCGLNQAANCCDNPSSFACWDGLHLTEAAYNWMANALIKAHFPTNCISVSTDTGFYEY